MMIRKEDGQSLVEFALVLPVLLMLVVGILDFGRILTTHLQMEMISQESVRMGGLGRGDEAIRSYAIDRFDGDTTDFEVTVTPTEGSRKTGDYVTVTLTYKESFFDVLGDASIPYTLQSQSTIRVE